MTSPRSAKAKGRAFEEKIVTDIKETFDLKKSDVRRVPASVNGIDVQLISEKAKKMFPYSVECKSQKKIAIPAWWKQATDNVEEDTTPLLVFRVPNTSTILTCMDWYSFLSLVHNKPQKHLNSKSSNNIDIAEKISSIYAKAQQDVIRLLEEM